MSIKRRITIGFGVLVATLLLLFSVFIYQNYESYRRSLMRNRLQRRALAGQLYFKDRLEFHRSSYLTLPDQHEWLIDEKNKLIYQSSGANDFELTKNLLAEARKKEVYFQYKAEPWGSAKEGVTLSFKIEGTQYVSVVTAYDLTGRQANESLLFILISGNVIMLVIVAFAGFWFARRALRPFDGLIGQMNPAAVNDFSFRLSTQSKDDEAAYLASSFNELLARLQTLAMSQEHFVSYASHEIRTPLTVVKGVLETSLAYDQSLADTKQSMGKALVRLEGAINLANSLLHLAEVEGLQSGQFKEDINIVDTILDTITYFGEKHPDQHIELQLTDSFTENTSSIRILGNSTLLRTVLNNILENASKYSLNKPVELIVDFDLNLVMMKVIDQGIGIPATQLEDVFLPMMRAANVGSLPGFGLGLTIAKKIIDMHQGQLTVDSAAGKGTTVCIFLPTLSLS
ncbi:HAMP domain-containing sensor histidine kinase [Dyadobacter psychrotolerans]|uniref:histidine kinase n=1 Tax=Dyadobacter psychrotolerans TaxID=2541721 RepID=A0A4R5D6N5_9BACT|nr:HAMP domain-containing sensor histidine kinase [Dyadobacter psychrotolerans]TDE09172.1 HAMP domain-containing histidine kinase [Dyadobacter psychrotolerans]